MNEGKVSIDVVFIDTNIWLYAFIRTQDADKHGIAAQLVQSDNIVISTQIINEVCINLIKKAGFSEAQIQDLIDAFYTRYHVVELTKEVLLEASKLREDHEFSFWDSLVIAASLFADARVLYSEDMQDGLILENKMTIVNAFK